MRLKEFYQLEFQIIYSQSTANDYSLSVIPAVSAMIGFFIGETRIEPSDRIPSYNVLEVAIGTDRVLHNLNGNERTRNQTS